MMEQSKLLAAKTPRNNFINLPDNNPYIRNPGAFNGSQDSVNPDLVAAGIVVAAIAVSSALFGLKAARENQRAKDTTFYQSNKEKHGYPTSFSPKRDTAWDPYVRKVFDGKYEVYWSGRHDLQVLFGQRVIKMKGGTLKIAQKTYVYSQREKIGHDSFKVTLEEITSIQDHIALAKPKELKNILEQMPYYNDND